MSEGAVEDTGKFLLGGFVRDEGRPLWRLATAVATGWEDSLMMLETRLSDFWLELFRLWINSEGSAPSAGATERRALT